MSLREECFAWKHSKDPYKRNRSWRVLGFSTPRNPINAIGFYAMMATV